MPLAQLVSLVADELRDLRDEGRRLEDAIAHAILDHEPTRREALGNLQKIDLIVQTLGELSAYVLALADQVPEAHPVEVHDMLARITLRDLAGKLAGHPRQPVVDEAGRISGEVDLF
ncbi:hypothetical protein GCM10017056_20620 [Seohaeicola zhoushanensis]|uniref:CBS domain-containing protein n=2 Tax=Seohaeicola zhoushanensis TaxID=1569283 RepID=A0A8J3M6T2_9RHOB|nr:hypothetical protein GCM10017056_20620 [Seohaeicola zhoushanensis]